MNKIRESLIGRCLNFLALLSFLLLQVPVTAFAGSGTKVTHDAIKFFVPEKRIRLEATVVDPKGVTLVRAYFKGKTQADYVFVPMEAQQTVKDSYVATLPALSKSNEALEYLFLAVNGANEVVKTEAFVVKAKDSKDVPSWQMVKDDEPMKLFTEVPDAPDVASSFSDSVSVDVVESGARFGLIAQLYSTSGSAAASGAAASATSAGVVTVTTAVSMTTMAIAAAAVVGGAAAAGGGGGGGSAPAPATVPNTATTGNVTSKNVTLCVIDSNSIQDDFYDVYVNNVRIGSANNAPGGSTCYNVTLNSGSNTVLLKLTTVQCCTTALTLTANPGNYSADFGGTMDHSWTIIAP